MAWSSPAPAPSPGNRRRTDHTRRADRKTRRSSDLRDAQPDHAGEAQAGPRPRPRWRGRLLRPHHHLGTDAGRTTPAAQIGRHDALLIFGTLNLITPEKRKQALALARDGVVVSCARTITWEPTPDGPHPPRRSEDTTLF